MFSVSSEGGQRYVGWPQIVWQVISDDGTMNGETAVSITWQRPWDDQLASVGRS